MQTELWSDSRSLTKEEILGGIIRADLYKESVKRINMFYLASHIDCWWESQAKDIAPASLKNELQKIILEKIKTEDHKAIVQVGNRDYRIAAALLESVFTIENKELAKNVHEAVAKIAGIVDIKYPYEEHKELFPRDSGADSSDWGKGLGIIRPHSDDIYENRDINIMSLTVCKDTSSTPTWFWLLKDVVGCLTDQELGQLTLAEATFYSGTNVEGTCLHQTKPILRHHDIEGITLRLDFRIDDTVGPRMRFEDPIITEIVTKMRQHLKTIRPISSTPTVGSVGILANFKILHGRNRLNPVMLYEGENSRILFRSKGIKEVYNV